MPTPHLLLRLLLCVVLVLNGIGTASASARMAWVHLQAGVDAHALVEQAGAPVATAADTGEVEPCHGHDVDAVAAADPSPTTAPGTETMPRAGHPPGAGNCCDTGHCTCACMFPTQAVVFIWAAPPATVDHAPGSGALSHAHATPALPHLIRPPIG